MPVFQSVYGTQSSTTLNQVASRKRKRGADSESRSPSAQSSPEPQASVSVHPVTRKDPYYIAGTSREESLPAPPFPHAPPPSSRKAEPSVHEQLAALKPPVFLPKNEDDDKASAKRRHADNVTTILHMSMLRGDWSRASRAWSLLVRTEIGGKGVDLRPHGRWAIGGEILMRRAQSRPPKSQSPYEKEGEGRSEDDEDHASGEPAKQLPDQPAFTDEGFKFARDYYQRFALQYPYTAQASRGILDARTVYPALFTAWIYEVQDRSKQARERLTKKRPHSSDNGSAKSVDGEDDTTSTTAEICQRELREAIPIAERMDELLLNPPYDSSTELLQLRGMIALWLADLHDMSANHIAPTRRNSNESQDDGISKSHSSPGPEERLQAQRSRGTAEDERRKAQVLFKKVEAAGNDLPPEAQKFLDS